jgi:hypothetical protein
MFLLITGPILFANLWRRVRLFAERAINSEKQQADSAASYATLHHAPRCASCAYFRNDPAYIEQAMPGLITMGSGYASVRAQDGICARHERYLSERSSCADHLPR